MLEGRLVRLRALERADVDRAYMWGQRPGGHAVPAVALPHVARSGGEVPF